jgi:hypothetical protein
VARQFGRARTGSTGSVALAGTVIAVATLLTVVFLAQVPAANPDAHSSSSSLGSSSSIFSSSSSTTGSSSTPVQSAAQLSASQYPLVWAPNSPKVCGDLGECFINATLGFFGNTTLTTTSSDTTIIRGDTTTIVHGLTTNIIRTRTVTISCQPSGSNATSATNHTSSVTSTSCTSSVTTVVATDGVFGSPAVSLTVWATAFFQDAVTGQNVTTSSGLSVIPFDCGIQATGFSNCYIGGSVPPGHTYKVTVFITKEYYPCSLKITAAPCTSQLLAPPETITVTE